MSQKALSCVYLRKPCSWSICFLMRSCFYFYLIFQLGLLRFRKVLPGVEKGVKNAQGIRTRILGEGNQSPIIGSYISIQMQILKRSDTTLKLPFTNICVSYPVLSDSLWPHGLQYARLPCPSLSTRVCSNSCSNLILQIKINLKNFKQDTGFHSTVST